MGHRRVAIAVLAATLVAVPLASAKSSLLADPRITGSGTNWALTIQNVSTDGKSIRCIRYFAASGVTITNVTTPAGWGSTGSSTNGFGFRQDDPGIAPGQTLSIHFMTSAPFTAGGTLHYSDDCVVDIVAEVPPPTPVTPPPPPPPPPPPSLKKPCKCLRLSVKLDPTLLNKKLRPDKHDFGVGITWTVTCTKGKGGCAGLLRFSPPKVFAGSIPEQHNGLKLNLKSVTFVCATKCATSKVGRFEIKMLSRDQLNKLFGRTLAFTVVTKCGKTVKKVSVKVFVDNTGRLKPVLGGTPPPPPPPTVSISEDDTWAYNASLGKGNICINVRTTPPQAFISGEMTGPGGYNATTNGQAPLHQDGTAQIRTPITQAGTYTDTLTVYDTNGKQTATSTNTFTVTSPPQNGPPPTFGPSCPAPTQ